MVMRISTSFFFSNGLHGMQRVQKQLVDTQERISTGNKILFPSEDPVATTKVFVFEEQLKMTEQYQENITYALNSNQLAESVLGQLEASIQRIRELAVQANNSHLNEHDLRSIANEIDGLSLEMANLMNSKDGVGDYLFSGFQGLQKPFIPRPGGGYEYRGDQGEPRMQVSSETKMSFSFSGKPVFVDVDSTLNSLKTSAAEQNSEESTALISVGKVVDQELFDEVYPENYILTFNDPPTTYNVIHRDDRSPVVGDSPSGDLINIPYADGASIQFNGLEFYISGIPQADDTFFIESTHQQDILTGMYRFSELLKDTADNMDFLSTVEGQTAFQISYEAALSDMDTALLSVSQERSRMGVNLNQLERLQDMHDGLIVELNEFLSSVRDVDIAEAATTLNQESFILQASQSSFAKITQLTIFNYI